MIYVILIDTFIWWSCDLLSHDHRLGANLLPQAERKRGKMSSLNFASAEVNNDLLIAEVFAREPLWQSRHPDHKHKLKKRALWAEVAAVVLPGDPRGGMSAFSLSAAVGYCC